MSVSETSIAYTWLYSTLSNDSILTGLVSGGIWRSMAPPNVTMPFITFNMQSGNDVITLNAFRIMANDLFQVRVTAEASKMDVILEAAARIDALIGSPPTSGTVTGGLVLASWRESPISLDELLPSGVLLHHEGGLYRMQLQKTS